MTSLVVLNIEFIILNEADIKVLIFIFQSIRWEKMEDDYF
jgi:hypothetical protein